MSEVGRKKQKKTREEMYVQYDDKNVVPELSTPFLKREIYNICY